MGNVVLNAVGAVARSVIDNDLTDIAICKQITTQVFTAADVYAVQSYLDE